MFDMKINRSCFLTDAKVILQEEKKAYKITN